MKTKQFVKQIWRTLFLVLSTLLLTFELAACDPEGKDYVVQDGDIMHFRFNV